jgi:hypothetical protein
MKETLFRGKRKDTGEWVYGFLLKVDDRFFIIEDGCYSRSFSSGGDLPDIGISCDDLIEVVPETVGECVTMKIDGKSVSVYEGDIIQTNNKMKNGFIKGVVKWIDCDGCFAVDTGNKEIFTVGKTIKYYKGKVVGNITDNIDLLK